MAISFVAGYLTGDSGESGGWGDLGFEDAVEECAPDSRHIHVIDDGAGVSMSSEGTDSDGASILDVFCVLDELDTPESVISRMDRTRALDGTQDATWAGIRASWTYHPDSGMSIILERERQ